MTLIHVSAIALIDTDGRVLLAERPQGKAMGGMWEFPGGKIEVGETPEQALIRELKEELAIDVSQNCLSPVGFVSHAYTNTPPQNKRNSPLVGESQRASGAVGEVEGYALHGAPYGSPAPPQGGSNVVEDEDCPNCGPFISAKELGLSKEFHLIMYLFAARKWKGVPSPQEGQRLKWVKPNEMRTLPMPPADIPLVSSLLNLL